MKWNDSEAKIVKTMHPLNNIPSMEQECHFNCVRYDNLIHVCCSDQTWITKLKKCPHFYVKELLVSSDTRNTRLMANLRILQVKGHLPSNALTLRLKIVNINQSASIEKVLQK